MTILSATKLLRVLTPNGDTHCQLHTDDDQLYIELPSGHKLALDKRAIPQLIEALKELS